MENSTQEIKLSVKVPFEGFYGSSHDRLFDQYLENELDHLEHMENYSKSDLETIQNAFYAINWQPIRQAYSKAYCEQVESLVLDESRQYILDETGARYLSEPFALSLEFESLESPKEYNFGTDCIYAKIPLAQLQFMLNSIPANIWREFIKEQCTSYDGFISFYSPDFDSWEDKENLTTWGEARLGMILECYLMQILEVESLHEKLSGWSIMEDKLGNGFIDDLIYTDKGFAEASNNLYEKYTNEVKEA